MTKLWDTQEEGGAYIDKLERELGKELRETNRRMLQSCVSRKSAQFVRIERAAAGEQGGTLPLSQTIRNVFKAHGEVSLHFRRPSGGLAWRVRQSGFQGTIYIRLWTSEGPAHDDPIALRRDEEALPELDLEKLIDIEIEYEPDVETEE